MTIAIVDLCHFTQLGMVEHLKNLGIRNESIHCLNFDPQDFALLSKLSPSLVFVSEECFYLSSKQHQQIKQMILDAPDCLFCIFMAISNNQFGEFLCVRDNVIITSKSVKVPVLNELIKPYLSRSKPKRRSGALAIKPLSLSKTESNMLKMWMSGNDTIQISDKMQIKAKTISSHKGNIKRKIKTHNTQVIYHVVRLADSLTTGIYVSLR